MMKKPARVQRKRTKGWVMPPGSVYVGRPTRWGNPFRAGYGICETADDAVHAFRALVLAERWDLTPLSGKDLACFCPLDRACHADVLLELANP